MRRWIEADNSWPEGAEARARAQLEALAQDASDMSEAQYFLAATRVVALADNGHSNVSLGAAYRAFGLLPVRTAWFDDGLFIVRAAPAQRELVGARVVAIAGQPVEALLASMAAHVGGTDELRRAHFHAPYLLSPALLHAAGLSEDPGRASLTVEQPGGARVTVELATYQPPPGAPHPWAPSWRYMLPEPLPDEGEAGWIAALSPTDPRPWSLQEPDEPFRYRFLADRDAAHIQLRRNHSDERRSLPRWLRKARGWLRRDRPRHVILDNRHNGGGDLTITADFVVSLAERLPDDGVLYSLTSDATFSAGIYTAMLPRGVAPTRTVVIGGHVGDRERFWAETGPPALLPTTSWRLTYATQLHDLGAGCHDPAICHVHTPRWNVRVGSFEPDLVVPTRAAEVFAGRDVQVERALAAIAGDEPVAVADARG